MTQAPAPPRLRPAQTRFHCPNCGGRLPRRFRYSKIAACDYCNSILRLEGADATILGHQAALAHYPSLFDLGKTYRYRSLVFEPVGMARFRYSAGYWEEWWVITQAGKGRWISVDEGDFALEESATPDTGIPPYAKLQIGTRLRLLQRDWVVTERDSAQFVGIRGEFPEALPADRRFDYVHLSAPGSHLITLEFDPGAPPKVFRGTWVDPFAIHPVETAPPPLRTGAAP